MTDQEKYAMYVKEFDRFQSLHATNLINQDNALIQLSAGLLAVLATFGSSLVKAKSTLGLLVFVFLGLTITQVIVSFYLSNQFFKAAKAQLTANYQYNKSHPQAEVLLNEGINRILPGQLNDLLNISSLITFFLAISFFFALVTTYF